MTGAVSIGWVRSCSGRPPVEAREGFSQARGNKTPRRKSARQPHSGFRVAGKGDTEARMRLSNVARAILPVVAHSLEGRATTAGSPPPSRWSEVGCACGSVAKETDHQSH